ncbi:MAG TPA: 4-hydroxythreonine-4-phosphate dehydrogenase PdxA [Candidatus Omnitrophota bacterium]|nr:4-hydroxythreonine-4-phosphate dehydrogenase PdxA [Candidatus Omnitrophota bacterium]
MKSKTVPISKSFPVRVGITMGDPAGVGPEVTAASLAALQPHASFVVIGDRKMFARACQALHLKNILLNPRIQFIDPLEKAHPRFSWGLMNAENGRASVAYLDTAMELLGAGRIDCLVTAPISKEAVYLAGYDYTGHTEYLAHRSGSTKIVMMLLNDVLRMSLVTRHIPLKNVSSAINELSVRTAIEVTADSLKGLFGIKKPRLVVCGVNPHASDHGLIGKEEESVVRPLLKKMHRTDIHIDGPVAADSAIQKALSGNYDAVITMYHDQALIALKSTDPKSGVNITLGLPFVRTSPLHGTAFDIAGKGIVDPLSMCAAVRCAISCSRSKSKTLTCI